MSGRNRESERLGATAWFDCPLSKVHYHLFIPIVWFCCDQSRRVVVVISSASSPTVDSVHPGRRGRAVGTPRPLTRARQA